MVNLKFNEYQSSIEDLHLSDYPEEIQEQFYDFVTNVPFIRNLVSVDRPRAKDLPRDEKGRAIIDICNPPILEDMDYFRPAALHFKEYGNYTELRPNPNPNSEYGKWIREEIRRCYEGYVRESDGMWVTGDEYFFLNYWPIAQTKLNGKSKKGERIIDFPEVWEGINLRCQYIEQAINGGLYDPNGGNNGCEISSRGKAKSYLMSAMIGKRFVLGESFQVNKLVKCMATAYQKQYLNSDGILNKFQAGIDFLAINTQFPNKRIKSSLQDMSWIMGYYDLDTGTQRGTLNEVIGVSAKDDISKVRGKRLNLIVVEEFGSFRNVLQLYNILIPSVQEGNISFGTLYLIGTAGDDESDFQGAQEIVYNPKGYRMYALPNVFDKEGQSKPYITFFFPGYMNRKGCYDENGNSDVTKAILEILVDRYRVKYNSSDINSITKTIAEIPITPQEAILRTRGNLFPITEITQRLTEIDSNPSFYDDVYVGDLVLNSRGEVEFIMNKSLTPIRDFPTKDNTVEGALEIYEMPQKINDKVPYERYIASLDNYENDQAESMSLGSMFVLDLWTDRIVAEYTGRPMFADDLNEKFRLLCMFYNARGLIENNKKNTFAYFSRMTSLHLLADTPEYLKSRQILKAQSFGNSSKGVPMTVPIRNFAFGLVRDWLLKPVTISREEEGQVITSTIPNLFFIKDRALLKEMSVYNPDGNFDRIMSLCQLMIYREEKMILYQGDMSKSNKKPSTYLGNDPFFKANYDERFGITNNNLNELNE